MKKMQTTGRENRHYCTIWPVWTFKIIFYILPDTGDAKDYKKTVDALNAYFVPKVDTTFARHCFRELTQAPGERIRQFATGLRWAAKDCNYSADTDNPR